MQELLSHKAFIAETAAKVAASISREYCYHGDLSSLKNKDCAANIAAAAVNVAEALGDKLKAWYTARYGVGSSFFEI